MQYVDEFVVPVPKKQLPAYRSMAKKAGKVWRDHGALEVRECIADDVPVGKVTDFKGAVKARQDEVIVFSWHEYPTKEAAGAAHEKIMSDPRIKELGATAPFDGQRMILGGFTPIVDESAEGEMGYVDGSVAPVPAGAEDAYRDLAAKQAAILKEYGATRIVEAWGDDVPDGEVTDYKGAVKATSDETVVYAWIEWPSKEVRDAGWQKVFADPRMHPDNIPYDNHRRVYGGFAPMFDSGHHEHRSS